MQETDAAKSAPDQMHQLLHDMRTYLLVVDLGARSLGEMRGDPETFNEMLKSLLDEGVEPLVEAIDALSDIVQSLKDREGPAE